MKKYRQLVVDDRVGDCFRACMATLLQLPPEVLPNDHSPMWHVNWLNYLSQFGLTLSPENRADQAIWCSQPWIASVRSLNYKGINHAILMHKGGTVFWDPSTKKRYRTGTSLLGKDAVVGGQRIEVEDAMKLHRLNDYRQWLDRA